MMHYARWKSLAILASVLLAFLLALPNVLPKPWQEKFAAYGVNPLTLGLDLQGGSNILLEVDRNNLRKKMGDQLTGDIRAALREAKIQFLGINQTDAGVTVRISNPADLDRAKTELPESFQQPLTSGLSRRRRRREPV